jgi:Glycosyl hydrolases family 43
MVCAVVLAAALWTDLRQRSRTADEETSLAVASAQLHSLRHEAAVTSYAKAVTTARRDATAAQIGSTLSRLGSVNSSLTTAAVHAYLQGASIGTLQTCLGGVQNALGHIAAKNSTQAAKDITAVASSCSQLDGGPNAGLVYPFDFPDPAVILVGQTYYAYATNSVAGNIQIISSSDMSNWTAVGNALPSLPTWATPNFTWAPAVAMLGGAYDLFYAVKVAGTDTDCISVATSLRPQGPFVDGSSGPLECQRALGGSIDPSPFVDATGAPYLVWKSGGSGSARLWSEPLSPDGTAFAAGATPTQLLAPDSAWEGGIVEAPDLVSAAGRYFLFFSGSEWNTASYAVGVATCAGPLGPCTDASPNPILQSGDGIAGPGGEAVFTDAFGGFHIAFHAWIPGAVGFPNSRDLYVRTLDLSGPVAGVGPAG